MNGLINPRALLSPIDQPAGEWPFRRGIHQRTSHPSPLPSTDCAEPSSLPQVVARDRWLSARRELHAQEDQLRRHHADVIAARRRLPMVRVEKEYLFEGSAGATSLTDLFGDRHQLVIFHLMFDPSWDDACQSCSEFAEELRDGLLMALWARDTAFAAVSRAPFDKLRAVRDRRLWDFPWYSSAGNDFNYDFHITLDELVAPVMYDFAPKAEIVAAGTPNDLVASEIPVELAGLSSFVRDGASVFHTYTTYERGIDEVSQARSLLELTMLDDRLPPGR